MTKINFFKKVFGIIENYTLQQQMEHHCTAHYISNLISYLKFSEEKTIQKFYFEVCTPSEVSRRKVKKKENRALFTSHDLGLSPAALRWLYHS